MNFRERSSTRNEDKIIVTSQPDRGLRVPGAEVHGPPSLLTTKLRRRLLFPRSSPRTDEATEGGAAVSPTGRPLLDSGPAFPAWHPGPCKWGCTGWPDERLTSDRKQRRGCHHCGHTVAAFPTSSVSDNVSAVRPESGWGCAGPSRPGSAASEARASPHRRAPRRPTPRLRF